MKIGGRLFPYPVLNSVEIYSSYKDGHSFKLEYQVILNEDTLILSDIHCDVNSKFLQSLIDQGKVSLYLLFECNLSQFRKHFKLSEDSQDILIPLTEINGACSLSAFAVANEDIEVDGSDEEFVDEYSDLTFIIEKYDIVAVDELHKERFDFDVADDIKKDSIFVVSSSQLINDGKMVISYDSHNIEIQFSKPVFDAYYSIKDFGNREIYYSMLAIPALTQCINTALSNSIGSDTDTDVMDDAINELYLNFYWFKSFCVAYKKKYNKDFRASDLNNLPEIVQILFDNPVGKSLIYLEKTCQEDMNDN